MMTNITCFQYTFTFLVLWFVSVLFLHVLFKRQARQVSHGLHLPPSPPALPVIGHLHYITSVVFEGFHNVSVKYGPLLYLRLVTYPFVLVSSAPLATEIFRTHDLNFSDRIKSPFEDSLLFGSSVSFFNAPYGEYWKFMKKISMTELLGSAQIKRSRNVRREELLRFLNKILEKAQTNEVVDLSAQVLILSNNSTCRMIMSARCSGEDNEAERCRQLIFESFELATKLAFASLFGPFRKLFALAFQKQLEEIPRKYDELFEKVLQEHEDRAKMDGGEREEKDLMDILLKVYHDTNAEVKITRAQIKTFFLDLFIGGTRTTADGILFLMGELINHPEKFKKLRDEIDSVVGKNRLVEESDVPNLPYLQAAVKETMRLHPPVPLFDRVCRETCKVGGYDMPKGMTVVMNVYSVMRDPKVWEDPNEFKPERFLVSDKEQDKQGEAARGLCDFVPFGGGRRQCPGTNLSMSITHASVAAMVQCFDWKVANSANKANLEPRSGLTLSLAKPLLCQPMVRVAPFPAQNGNSST
ncbi:hypothetical protein Tsubulata_043048 [Turnera subulata]|uniref:Cytochrome P450 n=1 Tax=Turnera subulata TaxID=218843 RepID=A0A9Q0FA91_9ROSI|nr:hypothetical protein Tsubulata_043048 [Turnera subulata]